MGTAITIRELADGFEIQITAVFCGNFVGAFWLFN